MSDDDDDQAGGESVEYLLTIGGTDAARLEALADDLGLDGGHKVIEQLIAAALGQELGTRDDDDDDDDQAGSFWCMGDAGLCANCGRAPTVHEAGARCPS